MTFPTARKRPAAPSETAQKSLVGTEIDTRCKACKGTTKHVVVAKVGSKPTRVRCLTCELEHEYAAARPRRVAETAPKLLVWAEAMEKARGTASPYSASTTYLPGSRVTHPTFGEGIVVRLASATVCEVLFEERIVKLLMQAASDRFVPPEPREPSALRRGRRLG
jgi:hypothetical protein